ncbi:MAG: alpha/beta hydrolase [Bacteroidota bacterium]
MYRINSEINKLTGLKVICVAVFLLLLLCKLSAQTAYGNNKEAGQYITLNGVKHYYEVYGNGKPLLLIHGNSTGIKGWVAQIEFFSKKYKVYAIDCRGRGNSDLGKDSLTFKQTAHDMATFIELLKLDSVNVIGKSDGGIVALMMGIYYPQHIHKMVAFSANLWPDTTTLLPETFTDIHNERVHAEKMLAMKDTTQNWYLTKLRNRLMEFQPHIALWDLQKIQVPVLVLSCDRDVVKEEHTLLIYKNIPKANLAILPNETHSVAKQNPGLFNTTIERFLAEPFKGYSRRFER